MVKRPDEVAKVLPKQTAGVAKAYPKSKWRWIMLLLYVLTIIAACFV